ncbi:MAG TPA: LCP family protein, partial [Mobilitalea sp.]|nr:LCP family protein [Mobilitalea sp.]
MKNVKKKKKKRLITILIVEITIVLLLFIGYQLYHSTLGKIQHDSSMDYAIDKNVNVKTAGYRNIVIFGVDSRENALEKSTNSDTIIIASVNNKTKDVKLVSVYRDTYVNIPVRGYDKINAAYFTGGYSRALTTLNKNFDLDLKEYVTVNFEAVVKAIDLLGGITIDVQDNEWHYLNGYVNELNKINGTNVPHIKGPGTQVLNGTQATAYARIRYTAGGDFKRTERQRLVITKMFEKLKSSDIQTVNSFIKEVFPQVYTNLSSTEILG